MIEEDPGEEELDAGLIAAAQRVEHYEIAGYGCVRTYAQLLGEDEAVELLEQTLNEEKETDEKLTELAGEINVEAQGAGEGEDKDEEREDEGESRKTARKSGKARAARA